MNNKELQAWRAALSVRIVPEWYQAFVALIEGEIRA